jgi:large subunit ribosomal protein L4
MSAKVLTADDAKKANIVIIENGKGTQAVHDVVTALRANRRTGSANTKTKAEVNLSGAKPWRQKGTGRARAGYKSSPIWRGGGVVFGPKPRDYSKKTPKSVRKLALRKALSARILKQTAAAPPKREPASRLARRGAHAVLRPHACARANTAGKRGVRRGAAPGSGP